MDNFWSYIIAGIASILQFLVYGFPTHTQANMVQTVQTITSTTVGITFAVALSNFNMTIPFLVFGIIFTLEYAVRVPYAIWRWLKKIIID